MKGSDGMLSPEYLRKYSTKYVDQVEPKDPDLLWFGSAWIGTEGFPDRDCHPHTHIPLPPNRKCDRCGKPLTITDQGVSIPGVNETRRVIATRYFYDVECWGRLNEEVK